MIKSTDITTDLVVKSNSINEGFIDMTKLQYKFTLYAISKIDKSDKKDFRKVCIHESELKELLEWKGENLYEYLKGFEDELLTKKLRFYSVDGERVNINWFSYTKYNPKEGSLEIAFNHDLAPYLLDINIPYTKYLLDNVISLSSKYSTRIYELLIQDKFKGNLSWERTISLEDLRKMLGIPDDKYPHYANFKRKAILQAQKEFIENPDTDITFKFEEIKRGRSVIAIRFLARYKEKPKLISTPKIPKEQIDEFINKFNDTYEANLAGTEQTKKIVSDLMNQKGLEHFENCLKNFASVINAEVKKGHIRSLEGLFMNYAKNEYNFNTNMMSDIKPEVNFDQRNYTKEDFEKYYYKVPEQ